MCRTLPHGWVAGLGRQGRSGKRHPDRRRIPDRPTARFGEKLFVDNENLREVLRAAFPPPTKGNDNETVFIHIPMVAGRSPGMVLGAAVGLTRTVAAQADPPTPSRWSMPSMRRVPIWTRRWPCSPTMSCSNWSPRPRIPPACGRERRRRVPSSPSRTRRTSPGSASGMHQVIGNQVSGRVDTNGNRFRTLGVGPVGHTFHALVQDGKIRPIPARSSPRSLTVNAAVAAQAAAAAPAPAPRYAGNWRTRGRCYRSSSPAGCSCCWRAPCSAGAKRNAAPGIGANNPQKQGM